MRQKKYAMVAINFKEVDSGKVAVRRVLIQYKDIKPAKKEGYGYTTFKGSRLVGVDDYFNKKDVSHKYTFTNENYTLVSSEHEDNILSGKAREYHYHSFAPTYCLPVFFKADSDEAALKQFNSRKELR